MKELDTASPVLLEEKLALVKAAQDRTPRGPAQRGRSYLRRVEGLEIEGQFESATASLQGRDYHPYEVYIKLSKPFADVRCTCPYSGWRSPCKHSWATLEALALEIEKALSNLDSSPRSKTGRTSPSRERAGQGRAPAWEGGLASLDAFIAGGTTSESSEDRVVWRVEVKRGQLRVSPYEQLAGRAGYSKGRRLSLKRLAKQDWPGSEVRAVANFVREVPGYHYYEVEHELDHEAALHALIGSRHVSWADSPEQAIEIKLGRVGFQLLSLSDGSLELAPTFAGAPLRKTPAAGSGFLVDVDRGASTITVGPVGEEELALIRALKDPRSRVFPAGHHEELLSRLNDLERLVSLKVPPGLEGQARGGDPRLRLRLAPTKGGLAVKARVRPVGSGGPTCVPGEGEAELSAWVEGKRVRYTRDMREELELASEILAGLSGAAGEPSDWTRGWEWEAEGVEALDLLVRIQDQDSELCVAEWPEGEKLSVSSEIGPESLRIAVRDRRDWFGLEGGIEIEGVEVPLGALLKLPAGERYLPLEGGRWLQLSGLLRERIASLRDVVHGVGDRVEVAATSAPIVGDFLAGVGEVELSEGWDELQARLGRAERVSLQPPRGLRGELRPYQREGFAWLKRLSTWGVGACLADDMGLGKTIQAIALLLARARSGPALVVAPTSLGANWMLEIQRFAPSLKPLLYRESDRSTVLAGLKAGDVVLISYDLARIDREGLGEVEWGTLVFDEAQQVKNGASKTARALQTLPGKWRLALTGTPVENHLGELWALFRLISPGLFGSWESFKGRFAVPIERDNSSKRRAALAALIRPFVLRRTKGEVLADLPSRSDVLLEVELPKREREAYRAARVAAILELGARDDAQDQRFQVLAAITKLRQLACHPRLVDPAWRGDSAKLTAFKSLLTNLREGGHRALVFSQFTRHLALVRDLLETEEVPFLYLDGQTPARKRQGLVDSFQEGEGLVFLISLKAGGRGLNLTGADYVVHLDPWWNPAVEDQASDRAHRLGQTKPVTVYRMIAKDTIEEQILQLHAEKRDLVAGILAGTNQAGRLSTDELLALIRGSTSSPPRKGARGARAAKRRSWREGPRPEEAPQG